MRDGQKPLPGFQLAFAQPVTKLVAAAVRGAPLQPRQPLLPGKVKTVSHPVLNRIRHVFNRCGCNRAQSSLRPEIEHLSPGAAASCHFAAAFPRKDGFRVGGEGGRAVRTTGRCVTRKEDKEGGKNK